MKTFRRPVSVPEFSDNSPRFSCYECGHKWSEYQIAACPKCKSEAFPIDMRTQEREVKEVGTRFPNGTRVSMMLMGERENGTALGVIVNEFNDVDVKVSWDDPDINNHFVREWDLEVSP